MKTCANCGAVNQDSAKFCVKCGKALGAAAQGNNYAGGNNTGNNTGNHYSGSNYGGNKNGRQGNGSSGKGGKLLAIILCAAALIAVAVALWLLLSGDDDPSPAKHTPKPTPVASESSGEPSPEPIEVPTPIEEPEEEPEEVPAEVPAEEPTPTPKPTPSPTPKPTPSPTPKPTPSPTPKPTPTPAPTKDPYYQDLLNAIAAADPRIVLPPESALFAPGDRQVKYVQGTYGQGIRLMTRSADGDRIGVIHDGVRVTVLALQDERALVQVEDGRYGWALSSRLVDKFDSALSYQRKRDYLVNHRDEWTNPSWYDFIMEHADDLPSEVVAAAYAAKYPTTSTLPDGDYFGIMVHEEVSYGVEVIVICPVECIGAYENSDVLIFRETGESYTLTVSPQCTFYDGPAYTYRSSMYEIFQSYSLGDLFLIEVSNGLVTAIEVPNIGYELVS